jgi:hypothetical protein
MDIDLRASVSAPDDDVTDCRLGSAHGQRSAPALRASGRERPSARALRPPVADSVAVGLSGAVTRRPTGPAHAPA